MKKKIDDLLAIVVFETARRKRVYPGLVQSGVIQKKAARRQIARIQSVENSLWYLSDNLEAIEAALANEEKRKPPLKINCPEWPRCGCSERTMSTDCPELIKLLKNEGDAA